MNDQAQDFAAGRRDTLHTIRTLADEDIPKFARIVVQDFVTYGIKMEDLEPLVQLSAAVTAANIKCTQAAIDDLLNGHSVYAITGSESIPTYRPITGGDYNAGLHSAVEDVCVLLASMNAGQILTPFKGDLKKYETLAGENEIRLAGMLRYNHGLLVDGLFMKIQEKILNKPHRPKLIAHDGGDAVSNKRSLGRAFLDAISSQLPALDKFGRRQAKIPDLWPPMKNHAAPETTQTRDPRKVTRTPEFVGPRNDSPGFALGFHDGLSALHSGLQKKHFEDVNNEDGYAPGLGMNAAWRKTVNETALNEFDDLRNTIREKLAEGIASGTGETYEDGLHAARIWVEKAIQNCGDYTNRKSDGSIDDLNRNNTLEGLRVVWTKNTKMIVHMMAETRKPKPDAPGPAV